MNDLAFELLQQKINKDNDADHTLSRLWIVDENITESDISKVCPDPQLQVICNRYDVYDVLKNRGFNITLNDFDFAAMGELRFNHMYYRVSKEKAIVHHIINSAANYLMDSGKLHISGYKNEGIKTYLIKAREYLGDCIEQNKGGKTSLLAVIQLAEKANANLRLDDKNYCDLRLINASDDIAFMSKPGLFGWNKIDKGSAFLISHLASVIQQTKPASIVDLGCGYGYLSVMIHQLTKATLIASDNNVAAVNACRSNFERCGINGSVVLADCADSIQQQVDMVVCNPPFHQGFSIENDLTLKFLQACKRLLLPKGQAVFVVNSFIPLERKAKAIFSKVETIDNNKQFKVISLIK